MTPDYKAIIVDDEASARSILTQLVHNHCSFIQVIDSFADLQLASKAIKKMKPDLVFLDIEMPNYAGYEITSFFDEINFEIIFVTAYDSYAIKAFEMAAFDYLLKPIETARLIKTLERFKNKSELKTDALNYSVLQEGLASPVIQKIIVNHRGDQKALHIDSIIALEANESYTVIYAEAGQKFTMSKNLKYFEKLFEDHPTFFRSHKSWIINTTHLVQYSVKNMSIHLESGLTAKLSKYKKAAFSKAITRS